jgi:hypothetical protein
MKLHLQMTRLDSHRIFTLELWNREFIEREGIEKPLANGEI